MTVEETLYMYARLRGIRDGDIPGEVTQVISSLLLQDHTKKRCSELRYPIASVIQVLSKESLESAIFLNSIMKLSYSVLPWHMTTLLLWFIFVVIDHTESVPTRLIDPWETWLYCNFKSVISEHMLWIKLICTSRIIAPRWMPQNTFDA